MSEEAELKLSVRPERAARIGKHPAVHKLKTGRARTAHHMGTYFDTPDLLLTQCDLNLRIREVGRHYIQTLKRVRPSDGANLQRDAWETDVAGNSPDVRHDVGLLLEGGGRSNMLKNNRGEGRPETTVLDHRGTRSVPVRLIRHI